MTRTKLSANAPSGNQAADHRAAILARIHEACRGAGRDPAGVELLAVSKGQPPAALRAQYALGQRAFGESYLKEALAKQAELPADCDWHFIGPLQSNKTRDVAAHFAWVHSVDRLRLARRLDAQRPAESPPLKVCVQVNVDGEAGKRGVAPDAAAELCAQVAGLPRLQLMGLMTLPRPAEDFAAQKEPFAMLRRLRDRIDPDLPVLSMGMSADLEAAVAAGSTLLRIGTALFGPRDPQPHPGKDQ